MAKQSLYRAAVKTKRRPVRPTRWNLIWNHWRRFDVSMEARGLFTLLATFADKQGECCFPSVGTLIKATGWSENTFYKHRAELLRLGWIKTKPRISRTGRDSTAYSLLWIWPELVDAITAKIEVTLPANFEDRVVSLPSVVSEEPKIYAVK